MKTKYIWRFITKYLNENQLQYLHLGYGVEEIHWLITNSDCAETVAHQIYEQLREGYKITELSLKCSNPMEIE